MTLKIFVPIAAAFALVTLAGCIVHVNSGNSDGGGSLAFSKFDGDRIVGSNVLLTEVRETDHFHSVMVAGSMDVNINVGGTAQIEISGDSNLLPYLQTEVANGVLEVKMEDGNYKFRQSMTLNITAPELNAAELYGSGDLTIEGVDTENLRVEVYGSGDVKASGRVDRVEARVAGSGDISMYDLIAREALVRIAGSGDIRLHVTESLDASVSGSGDVRYKGTPAATIRMNGSGDVTSTN